MEWVKLWPTRTPAKFEDCGCTRCGRTLYCCLPHTNQSRIFVWEIHYLPEQQSQLLGIIENTILRLYLCGNVFPSGGFICIVLSVIRETGLICMGKRVFSRPYYFRTWRALIYFTLIPDLSSRKPWQFTAILLFVSIFSVVWLLLK